MGRGDGQGTAAVGHRGAGARRGWAITDSHQYHDLRGHDETISLANSSSNALRRWLPMPSGTATKSRSCMPRRLQIPGRATRAAVSARRDAQHDSSSEA